MVAGSNPVERANEFNREACREIGALFCAFGRMAGELSVEKYVHKLLITVDFLWKSGVPKISDMPLTQLQAQLQPQNMRVKLSLKLRLKRVHTL